MNAVGREPNVVGGKQSIVGSKREGKRHETENKKRGVNPLAPFSFDPVSEHSFSSRSLFSQPSLTFSLDVFAWVFKPTGLGSPFLVCRGGLKLFAVGDEKPKKNRKQISHCCHHVA